MTNAELAILTLIAETSRHGYEIEQIIEERGMREWTEIGFSSIYYLLNKLEKQGCVVSRIEKPVGRGPARKVYEITESGLEIHRKVVIEALSTPKPSYSSLLLGLANLPGLSSNDAFTALRNYQESLDDRLEQIRSRRESQRPLQYFVEAMFEHSMAMVEAELNWIKSFIRQMEAKHD